MTMREAGTAKPSFWRHTTTGETGHLVSRDGREFIRIDRPGDTVERTFRPGDWIPEVELRPLSPMVRARICYAADQELCTGLGLRATKPWLNLSERERASFMHEGPSEPARRVIYDGIMQLLGNMDAEG